VTGPYVITTHRPCECDKGERNPLNCWACSGRAESRRAVAMLEEIADELTERGYSVTTRDVEEHIHAGGTIGPLPDGTVITVEPMDVPTERLRLGLPVNTPTSLVLDAFNARHGGA
jgi:hypothetical protein